MVNNLTVLGMKDYTLHNFKAKKMDDKLPRLLFTQEIIEKAFNARRFDMFLALLPSFLLINTIFSTELIQEKRIEL